MKRKILTLLLVAALNTSFFHAADAAEVVPFTRENFSLAPNFSTLNVQPHSENFSIKTFENRISNIFNPKKTEKNMPERKSMAIYTGTCGTNVTWNLETDTGVLTISGSGAMTNSSTYVSQPWYSYHSSIVSVIIENGVTSIGRFAFYDCSKLKSVTISNSVTSIGYNAFYSCSNLTTVTIPDNVTNIDDSAFSGCKSLTDITIPASVKSIGDKAFYECNSLTEIRVSADNANYEDIDGILFSKGIETLIQCPSKKTGSYEIPDTVKDIGHDAFRNCNDLTNVTIPDSVTKIEKAAFYGCGKLDSIAIPASVMSIEYETFYGCSSLTNVTIPDNVTSIDGYAFYNCNGLTSVTIGNGVANIGGYAFAKCSSLTNLKIPDNVTSVGDYAFSDCNNLSSVKISSGVSNISKRQFSGCSNLNNVIIPDNVTSIDDYAFYNCTSLTSVTIGNGVMNIGNYAFAKCSSLNSVEIPNSVAKVGSYAFLDCSELNNVTIRAYEVDENNGKVWSRSKSALTGSHIDFATYGNDRWVSGAYDGIFYSDDNGKTWIESNISTSCDGVIYQNRIWLAWGYDQINNNDCVYYSADGIEWAKIKLPSENFRLKLAKFENGLWFIGDYKDVYYSADGINWMQATGLTNVSFIAYANSLWVAGGYDGIYYSSDGKSWTQGNFSGSSCNMAKYENNIWVLSGLSSDTGLYYSTDGINWTQSDLTTGGFKTITYADGIWLAGGYNSNGLYYSIDGKNWTQTNLTSGNFYAIIKANDLWVAGNYGDGGSNSTGLYYSIDGKIWTKSNVISGSFEHIKNVDGMWLAGSGATSVGWNGVYFSKDGKIWTQSICSDPEVINFSHYYIRFLENANGVWLIGTYSNTGSDPVGLFYSSIDKEVAMGIGSYAFSGCTNLFLVNFVGSIAPKSGEDVFKNCPEALKIKVPRSYKNQTFCGLPVQRPLTSIFTDSLDPYLIRYIILELYPFFYVIW